MQRCQLRGSTEEKGRMGDKDSIMYLLENQIKIEIDIGIEK